MLSLSDREDQNMRAVSEALRAGKVIAKKKIATFAAATVKLAALLFQTTKTNIEMTAVKKE